MSPTLIHTHPMHRIATRHPRGGVSAATLLITEPEQLGAVVRDASAYPGGWTVALACPRTEADVATVLQQHRAVLPIGAQTSVTGGATPFGAVVLSTAHMTALRLLDHDRVQVQAGVSLGALQDTLRHAGRYYPSVPSYAGASIGGAIATNAAGPATFKYGSTRDWVHALTVVLANGEVLDIERGQCVAHAAGYFEIDGAAGLRRVPVPTYHMPDVAKRSAGYFAAPGMDLVDLFIGAEGTLGVITEATLRVVAPAPQICVVCVACLGEAQALALTARLRDVSLETRRTHDLDGLDVSAIEYLDQRSLLLLREHGADQAVTLAQTANTLLLLQVELPAAADAPLAQLRHVLEQAGVLDHTEFALPHEHHRAEQILALREAVPKQVNARIAAAQRAVGPAIVKVGADMIVPFAHLSHFTHLFRDHWERLGIEYAIWGHASDGNLHPNALPRSVAETTAAQSALLEIGKQVAALGGCPLAEHGVGRNPIKQALLRQLYGDAGIEQMRAVKQVLDPDWKLAPGNLFPA